MRVHRSFRRVLLISSVAAILALQFMYVMNAAGAPKKVVQRQIHAADSRELVAAGNQLKAVRTKAVPAPLARTGDSVSPTLTIALMFMLDGVLMVWLTTRPREQRA